MVEMAVCFPVFMLVLLGIIEFGRALMVSQMLSNASREACRAAVLEGATNAEVETLLKDLVSATVNVPNSEITSQITVTDRRTDVVDTSPTAIQDATRRDLVRIDISVPADVVSYTPGGVLTGKTLRGQCAMQKE